MPTPNMPPPDSMEPSMPPPEMGGAPQMPGGIGPDDDMIMLHRSSFEDLKEILAGIMTGIDEILAAETYNPQGGEMEAPEGAEEPGEGMSEGGAMPPAGASDEEFLKSLAAEANNRSR